MEKSDLLIYLLKTIAIHGCFLGIYFFLLKNRMRHQVKRCFLLGALIFTFFIPLVPMPFHESVSMHVISDDFEEWPTFVQEYELVQVGSNSHDSGYAVKVEAIVVLMLLSITFFLLLRSLFYLLMLNKIKNSSEYVRKSWFKLYKTHQEHSFSFFSNVFISQSIFRTAAFDQILEHECEHVRRRHSLDRLLLDFMIALFWFNPFMYLYRRALIEVHEYQADAAVLKKYDDPVGYQEVLFSQLSSASYSGLVSHCNFSMIKKRIVMMNKMKTKHSKMVYWIAIPTVLSVVFAFSSGDKISLAGETNTRLSSSPTSLLADAKAEKVLQQSEKNIPSIAPMELNEKRKVTSHFGMRKDPIDGKVKPHYGIDFSARIGTPVVATADGIVMEVAKRFGGYGKVVTIDHGGKYQTKYAQLSSIEVEQGEQVKRGQLIAKSGNSGRSTAPHLHYEVIETGRGRKDPVDFIKDYQLKKKFSSIYSHEKSEKPDC